MSSPRMRLDRDLHAARLKERFRLASAWRDEPITISQIIRYAIAGTALGFGAVGAYTLFPSIDWSATTTMPATCSDARRMGIAPMRRGEPGYRAELDADNDGVACEPYITHRRLR